MLQTFDNNLFRSLCVWTHEMKVDSYTIMFQSQLTELPIFVALSEQFWHHRHLRPPEVGRRDLHIFIWIQPCAIWRSVAPHSFVWSCQLDQPKLLKQRLVYQTTCHAHSLHEVWMTRHLDFLIWDWKILIESLFFQFLLIALIIAFKLLISCIFTPDKLNYQPLSWSPFLFW
jgi:hypothetical protein